jgi:VWFA-related protein
MNVSNLVLRRAGWLALIALLQADAAPAQVTFSSKVDSVRVDALITVEGRPLPGLTAVDFEIRDNGRLQTVTMLAAGSFPVDVVLALDMSSSLTPERLTALQAASRGLVGAIGDGDRAALLTFNHAVIRRAALTGSITRLEAALTDVSPSGRTALIDAMYAAVASVESGDRRTLLIVFSDGIDTASWLAPDAVVHAARKSGTVIYAVSTGDRSSTPEVLQQVSEATGGRVLHVDSTRLQTAFVEILKDFRHRYLLSYTLAGTPQPGWHDIQVRVKRRGAVVRARQGYFIGAGR